MTGALMLLAVLHPGAAPQVSLAEVAAGVRRALEAGDVESVVARGDRIRLFLPGVEPSAPVGAAQAAAALRSVLGSGGAVEMGQVRELEAGQGYVELRRQVHGPGGESRRQQILLRYRFGEGTWTLIEVRVT